MWSISLPLLLAGTAAVTPVIGTACPAMLRKVRLSYSQVIDGPPEERAILKEDEDRWVRGTNIATWDVGYVYEQGRQVHLVCEYAKGSTVVVKINRPVKTCTYTGRGPRESLVCR